MRFVAFVVTEGAMPAAAIEEMNRDWPAYAEEMDRRAGLRLGRELDLPEAGVATIRVRRGEALVTDGPFVESKEFLAGIEVFECADLDEAIQIESRNPVARFNPFEIRPLPASFRLGPAVSAFAAGDDTDGIPYLLTVWSRPETTEPADASLIRACNAWRADLEDNGILVLGGSISGPDTAATLRAHNAKIEVSRGPFLDIPDSITALEVVRCADLDSARELATGHPLARIHAVEVRSFYSEAAPGS